MLHLVQYGRHAQPALTAGKYEASREDCKRDTEFLKRRRTNRLRISKRPSDNSRGLIAG
jgi:hypothetical protein